MPIGSDIERASTQVALRATSKAEARGPRVRRAHETTGSRPWSFVDAPSNASGGIPVRGADRNKETARGRPTTVFAWALRGRGPPRVRPPWGFAVKKCVAAGSQLCARTDLIRRTNRGGVTWLV
jgi:hypothetical protein